MDHHVRLDIGNDLAKLRLAEPRPVDERLPRRRHERLELFDRRPSELLGSVANEVLPELAGVLGFGISGGRGEVNKYFVETKRGKLASP